MVIFVLDFGRCKDHAELGDFDLGFVFKLFFLFDEEIGELCLCLFWGVKIGIEFSDESDLLGIPNVFVPFVFVEEARIVSEDLMNGGNLFNAGDCFGCGDTMDNIIPDCASGAVTSDDLLVSVKVFLMDCWIACPMDEIHFFESFSFVVPNDDIFSKCGLDGV